MSFEPVHGFGVEVVGRLVEKQQVGLLEQQLAQGDATPFSSGQNIDDGVRRGALESIHGLFQAGINVPGVVGVEFGLEIAHLGHQRVEVRVGFGHLHTDLVEAFHLRLDVGHGLFDVLLNRFALRQWRLLQKNADGGSLGEVGLSVVRLLQPRHHLQQRRLTRAVRTHDTDLRAGEERQRDVIEDQFLARSFTDLLHRVDELRHRHPFNLDRWPVCQLISVAEVPDRAQRHFCSGVLHGRTHRAQWWDAGSSSPVCNGQA